jgi:hypothetical protein
VLTRLAAFLLLFLKDEEESFWMLSTILEDILPKDFFSPKMMSLQVRHFALSFPELIKLAQI